MSERVNSQMEVRLWTLLCFAAGAGFGAVAPWAALGVVVGMTLIVAAYGLYAYGVNRGEGAA